MRTALIFLVLAAMAARGEDRALPKRMDGAEKDAAGVTWAWDNSSGNTLSTFDGTGWSSRSIDVGKGALAIQMGHLSDGSVVCLWREPDNRLALSRHLGKDSRVLASGSMTKPEQLFEPALLPDSGGGLWITSQQREIFRFHPDGTLNVVYTVKPEDLVKAENARYLNPICAVEDGRGRIWIWSAYRASNHGSLRGVLIFDGTAKERQKKFAGITSKFITAIAPRDDRSMWLGVPKEGLFTVNIETFAATPVPPPNKTAFANIHNITPAGGDLYVIAGERPGVSALWQLHEEQWTKVIADLGYYRDIPRFFLPAAGGLIVNAMPSPWFLREGAEPVRLDWARGLPVEGVKSFLPLSDERYLVIGRDVYLGPLTLPPQSLGGLRTKELMLQREWTVGPDGHMWMIERDRRDILREWTGTKWRDHALPAEMDSTDYDPIEADEQGRIWFMPRDSTKPMAFFASSSGIWRQFPGIGDAFLAVAKEPPSFAEKNHRLRLPKNFRPAYRDGRVVYRDANSYVNYFDGKEWHKWRAKEITGIQKTYSTGAPFFDAAGNPAVSIKESTWTLADDKWTQANYDASHPDDRSQSIQRPRLELPDGWKADFSGSALRDARGIYWFVSERTLYKGLPGRRVKVFADGETNPFTMNRMVQQLFVDRHGTAFINTASEGDAWFMISPRGGEPPRTTLTVRQTDVDAVEAVVEVKAGGPVESRWKFDDKAWRPLKEKTITLESLPIGKHMLRVETFDEELRDDPSPAVAEFEIRSLPKDQVATLISRLRDPDYARRESAITALARQPETTLPALREARAKAANDDEKWWLDASIQAVERQRIKMKP